MATKNEDVWTNNSFFDPERLKYQTHIQSCLGVLLKEDGVFLVDMDRTFTSYTYTLLIKSESNLCDFNHAVAGRKLQRIQKILSNGDVNCNISSAIYNSASCIQRNGFKVVFTVRPGNSWFREKKNESSNARESGNEKSQG